MRWARRQLYPLAQATRAFIRKRRRVESLSVRMVIERMGIVRSTYYLMMKGLPVCPITRKKVWDWIEGKKNADNAHPVHRS